MHKLILLLTLFTFTSRGQIRCDSIPENFTGICESFDQEGIVSRKEIFEKGVTVERTLFDKKGDTTNHSTFSGKHDLTSTYRKYYPGNIIDIDIQQVNGTGTFTVYYPFGGITYAGQTKDSACTGDWSYYGENGELLIQLSGYAVKGIKCQSGDDLTKMMLENAYFMRSVYKFALESNHEIPWVLTDRREYIKEMEEYIKNNHVEEEEAPYIPVPPPKDIPDIAKVEAEVIEFPEKDAEFPGGHTALRKFIYNNFNYPKEAVDAGIQGKVFLSFIVEETGYITHVKVERAVHPALDEEAKRLIYNMPRWNPAESNGKPVRTRVMLPIVFVLSQEK